MNEQAIELARPDVRPQDPRFSSGPCKKHPGWNFSHLPTSLLGRSHRAAPAKKRIQQVITRSKEMLSIPDDWQVAIVPASDTGAFEMSLWSMLGQRPVDAWVWDSFSSDWANDIEQQLVIENANIYKSGYGELPDMSKANAEHDQVFVFNGTTSGVRVKSLDWIPQNRKGLSFCDATSAVFAMEIDYSKLDVVTWSWQKALGGEAGFGMLALSPAAIDRLESFQPSKRPLPKIFRMTKNGVFDQSIFQAATINTVSLIAVEDIHSALDWADSIGGLAGLMQRSHDNLQALNDWLQTAKWVDWLAADEAIRSSTSMCLKVTDPIFASLDEASQRKAIAKICSFLDQESVAYDIAAYRSAPPGFRVWGGATVDASDIAALGPWLDWAFAKWKKQFIEEKEGTTS